MLFFAYLAVVVVLAFALQPKTPGVTPPNLNEISVPTAKQGKPIPKVFGRRIVQSPNIVWYGDMGYNKIEGKSK